MTRNRNQLPRRGAARAAASVLVGTAVVGLTALVGLPPAAAAAAGSFNATGSMATGREHATATVLKDGEVLVAGGQDAAGAPLASASLYNPSNGSWTVTGPLPLPVSQATAILLSDGDVLVAGGLTGSSGSLSATAACELYDPTTGTWSSTKGPLLTASFGAGAAVLSSGQVVYAGGLTSTAEGATATDVTEVYNPAAGTWSVTGPLPLGVARAEMTALSNDNVLVAGGETGSSGALTGLAEVYQPSSGAWTAVSHMPTAVAEATTTVLSGDAVLVAGGETSTSGAPTARAQLFDPATSSWSTAGDLPTASYGATATLLGSGQVLYAGGLTSAAGAPTKAVALFAPASNSWSATGDLLVARGFGVAARLADGDVIIAAGQTTSGVTGEGEIYAAGVAPAITSAASLHLHPGTYATFTITTSGSPAPVLSESGALPPGLVFHANTGGTATISGTPPANATGTYKATITATNGVGSAAVQVLVISFYGTAPTITSSARVFFQAGVYFGFTVTTSGLPTPVLTESGALPPGLVFRPNGNGTATIYGTPPAYAAGTYQVSITASNGAGTAAVQYLVMSLGHEPAITSADSLVLQPGAYRAFTVTTSGTPTPVLSESGALPPGLVFRPNGNGTATIYGTPPANATASYRVTITALNGVGRAAVQVLGISFGRAPAITSAASLVLHRGVYGTFAVTTSGSPTPVLKESGALPPGVVFRPNSNGTATIYGTPAANAAGTYDLTITATNGSGTAVQHLVITFYRPAPGYWLATANGQVYGLGAAGSYGGVPTSGATGPVVGMAGTPSANGYWVVTANGTVAARGDAHYYGDLPGLGKHVSDIVAIAATTDGKGYYLVGADGGFFTFGDARFHGSLPGEHVHAHDIVGMVATPGGAGYLLVGSDGGVFTFGTTRFYGSLPGEGHHVHDVRAILPASSGKGYVLVGADGGVFNFGSGVKFYGSLPGIHVKTSDVVGIALTPDDGGYYMAGADGHVYGFGDAHSWAEPAGLSSNLPVAAIAGT